MSEEIGGTLNERDCSCAIVPEIDIQEPSATYEPRQVLVCATFWKIANEKCTLVVERYALRGRLSNLVCVHIVTHIPL